MKPYTLLTALLVFVFSFTTSARGRFVFAFDSAAHFNFPASFNNIRVIDTRADTSNFGVVETGFGKLNIVTSTPFPESLSAFGHQLIRNNENSANTLLIVLRNLNIVPLSKDRISNIQVWSEFYIGNNDSYKIVFSADSFFEDFNVRGDDLFDDGKNEAWKKLHNKVWLHYFQRAAQVKEIPESGTIYSEAEAANRYPAIKAKLPLYNTREYPKGIYFTREEFLNLKPGLTEFKETDLGDEAPYPHRYYRLDEHGKKGERIEEKDYYAVFNGVRWYKSGNRGLYVMHFRNNEIYLKVNLIGLKGLERHTIYPALIPLLIDAIVVDAMNQSTVDNDKQMVVSYRVRLDAERGKYIPEHQVWLEAIKKGLRKHTNRYLDSWQRL